MFKKEINYGLTHDVATRLVKEKWLADYFEEVMRHIDFNLQDWYGVSNRVANLILNEALPFIRPKGGMSV